MDGVLLSNLTLRMEVMTKQTELLYLKMLLSQKALKDLVSLHLVTKKRQQDCMKIQVLTI